MAVNVILVEPDENQQKEFSAAVKGSSFEAVRFLQTNAEAVEAYDHVHHRLVVLRLVSGKEGANQALDQLRKKDPSIRVAVSYNVRSTHLLMSAYAHGAVGAIKQPFRLHRVVEKLTFAVASERHDKLRGPIVRLEHPVEVRYKPDSFLARSRVGFSERLGTTDMDLNTERPLKERARLRIELLLPPPAGTMKLLGLVEESRQTKMDSWCSFVSISSTTSEDRKAIEAFLVRAAQRA